MSLLMKWWVTVKLTDLDRSNRISNAKWRCGWDIILILVNDDHSNLDLSPNSVRATLPNCCSFFLRCAGPGSAVLLHWVPQEEFRGERICLRYAIANCALNDHTWKIFSCYSLQLTTFRNFFACFHFLLTCRLPCSGTGHFCYSS